MYCKEFVGSMLRPKIFMPFSNKNQTNVLLGLISEKILFPERNLRNSLNYMVIHRIMLSANTVSIM